MHSEYFLENYIIFAERNLLVLWKLFYLIFLTILCLAYGFLFNCGKGTHLEKLAKFWLVHQLVQTVLANLRSPRLWAPDCVQEVPSNCTEHGAGVS